MMHRLALPLALLLSLAGCRPRPLSCPTIPPVPPTTRAAPGEFGPIPFPAPYPQPGERFVERLAETGGPAFDMTVIFRETFHMGSPDADPDRRPNELPQHAVRIEPFWVGRHEVTADLIRLWISESLQVEAERGGGRSDYPPLSERARRAAAAAAAPSGKPYAPYYCGDLDADLSRLPRRP